MKKNYTLSPANLILTVGVLLLTYGCIGTSNENDITYFGGKIKNPKNEYVYLSKNSIFIDTAKIDSNNKFSFNLNSIELGLYTFHHADELQFIYLEPKDSLLIYLNTWDFDESLIYSGNLAAKNNYLINSWLVQEKFEKNFKDNYRLNENEFSELIETEIQRKLATYNELMELEGEEYSEFFDKLAKIGIYYPLYSLKEYYPIKNKKALKLKSLPEVSEDFYSYRKTLDINDSIYLSYYPYRNYVLSYLSLEAYKEYLNNPEKNNVSLNYMKVVNNEITSENLKNELLARKLWGSLMSDYMSEDNFKEVHDYFFEYCSDDKYRSEIKKSIKQKEQLKRGDKLPDVVAINVNGEDVNINNLTKDNDVVIYFWPKHLGYADMLQEKLTSLQDKYPDVLFIGIERDKSNEEWIKFIKSKKLSKDNQFMLSKNSESYAYFEGDMARTIIVKSNGNIHNGYLFFNDKNFDEQLKKLNKQ